MKPKRIIWLSNEMCILAAVTMIVLPLNYSTVGKAVSYPDELKIPTLPFNFIAYVDVLTLLLHTIDKMNL